MRVGKHPLRNWQGRYESPSPITLAIVAWIPALSGYHADALDILALTIASARANTVTPFDILVLDNGSCGEVRRWLQDHLDRGVVNQILLCERNIGSLNGKRLALLACPGDTVVYSDCDVFFQPGWLETFLSVRRAFPDAGMIGAHPGRHFKNRAQQLAAVRTTYGERDHVSTEDGDFIPEATLRSWARSVGEDPEEFLAQYGDVPDLRVERMGVSVLAGAGHFAYCTSKEVLLTLPHHRWDRATGDVAQVIDDILDDRGVPRVSTIEPVCYHIGNRLVEPWILEERHKLLGSDKSQGVTPASPRPVHASYRHHWFWGRWRVRRILQRLAAWIWERYYV